MTDVTFAQFVDRVLLSRVRAAKSLLAEMAGWRRVIEVRIGTKAIRYRTDATHGLVRIDGPSWRTTADLILTGDPVAMQAVFGGLLSPLAAWREGQLELEGAPEDCERLDRLLAIA